MKNPLVKVPIKYSLFALGFSIILFFVLNAMDQNPLIAARLFDFLIIPLMAFLCIKEFKDYHNQKELRFWQGMSLGVLMTVFFAILYAAFLMIYLNTGGHTIFDAYIHNRLQLMHDSEAQLQKELGAKTYTEAYAKVKNAVVSDIALDDIIKKFFTGLFFSPIFAIILRTSPIGPSTANKK